MSELYELSITELDLVAGGGEATIGIFLDDGNLSFSGSVTNAGANTSATLSADGTAVNGEFEASFMVAVTTAETAV